VPRRPGWPTPTRSTDRAGVQPASGDPRGDPRLGAVILTYNRVDKFSRTVERTLSLPERPRIVVDNGSSDGTPVILGQGFPAVRCLTLSGNPGVARRDAGVAAVDRPYVALCNDDTWWEPGSLGRAADLLDQHPRLAAIGGRVLVRPETRFDPACGVIARSPITADVALPWATRCGSCHGRWHADGSCRRTSRDGSASSTAPDARPRRAREPPARPAARPRPPGRPGVRSWNGPRTLDAEGGSVYHAAQATLVLSRGSRLCRRCRRDGRQPERQRDRRAPACQNLRDRPRRARRPRLARTSAHTGRRVRHERIGDRGDRSRERRGERRLPARAARREGHGPGRRRAGGRHVRGELRLDERVHQGAAGLSRAEHRRHARASGDRRRAGRRRPAQAARRRPLARDAGSAVAAARPCRALAELGLSGRADHAARSARARAGPGDTGRGRRGLLHAERRVRRGSAVHRGAARRRVATAPPSWPTSA
jgi:glycosyltransferase involved in cell wall biosynthesis